MAKSLQILAWVCMLMISAPLASQAQIGGKLKSLKKKVKQKVEGKTGGATEKTGGVTSKIPKVKMACEERSGTQIYKLTHPIYAGNSDRLPHFIQFVEVNEHSTVLYFVSYGDWALSFAPIKSEGTPHLMWNGTNEIGMSGADREKFMAKRYRDTEKTKPGMYSAVRSHYAIEFERIPNYVCKVHVYIPSTTQIQGQAFFDLKLDPSTKVSREEMDAIIQFQKCSFQGGDELAVGGKRTYKQAYDPENTQHQWTVEGDAEIVGSANGATVVVSGKKKGTAKLCMDVNYGTEIGACKSCREIKIVEDKPQTPYFDLATCGNFRPYWGFEVLEEARVAGATYSWEISAKIASQTSKDEIKEVNKNIKGNGAVVGMIKPPFRGAPFTIQVTATYPDGSTASHSQTFHHVFDCPNKNSRYTKRNLGLE